MAQAQVLRIPEIVSENVQHFHSDIHVIECPGPRYQQKKRTLLRAALTCKSFFEIALNVFWRSMIDPWPLF